MPFLLDGAIISIGDHVQVRDTSGKEIEATVVQAVCSSDDAVCVWLSENNFEGEGDDWELDPESVDDLPEQRSDLWPAGTHLVLRVIESEEGRRG